MGDEDDRLVFEEAADALLEEVPAHLSVHSGQGVVEEVESGLPVAGSSQGDSGTLTTRQGNTSISNQG